MLGISADDKHCVTVEAKVVGRRPSSGAVVGRRLQHSTIELACTGLASTTGTRPEAEQPSLHSGLSVGGGMAAGGWCRVRAPSSGRHSGPFDLFAPNVTHMYHVLTQRALLRAHSRAACVRPLSRVELAIAHRKTCSDF